jgi:shikimate dehydrogenase
VGLVVNTTTLGMHGQPDIDLELIGLNPAAAVFDCVYNPLDTPLLDQARRRGFVPVDGLGMLLHQARPGFKAWFGVEPEITDELRALVAQGL